MDLQSLSSHDYARIDDIVYSLFGSKRPFKNYKALLPSRAFLLDSQSILNEMGLVVGYSSFFHLSFYHRPGGGWGMGEVIVSMGQILCGVVNDQERNGYAR